MWHKRIRLILPRNFAVVRNNLTRIWQIRAFGLIVAQNILLCHYSSWRISCWLIKTGKGACWLVGVMVVINHLNYIYQNHVWCWLNYKFDIDGTYRKIYAKELMNMAIGVMVISYNSLTLRTRFISSIAFVNSPTKGTPTRYSFVRAVARGEGLSFLKQW